MASNNNNEQQQETPPTETTPFDEDVAAMDDPDQGLMQAGRTQSVSFADEPPALVEDVTRDTQNNEPARRRTSSLLLKSVKDDASGSFTIKAATEHAHMDLTTGATTTRCQSVRVVAQNEQLPTKHTFMYNWNKRMKQAEETVTNVPIVGDAVQHALPEAEEPPQEPEDKQYRIVSKLRDDSDDPWLQWKLSAKAQQESFYVSWLASYLHWTFRTTFFGVVLSSFVAFMTLITFFALLVYWIDVHQPECIVGITRTVDANGDPSRLPFGDAWHLSWTTLSTVGYGVIAPGLPSTTENESRCTAMNMLMAFESFVGVLFGGITGAIVFAKVARIQSVAPVVWSDPIVVRYGSGCVERAKDYDAKEVKQWDQEASGLLPQQNHSNDETSELPCPILEFRLVNTMWNQGGGEIMDASVNLVVSRLETPHEQDLRNQRMRQKRRPGKKGKRKKVPLTQQQPPQSPQSPNVDRSFDSSVSSPSPQKKVTIFEEAKSASGSLIQKINQSIISSAVAAAHMPMSLSHSSSGSHDESSHHHHHHHDEAQPYNKAQVAQEQQEQRDMHQLQQQQELEKQLEEAVEKEVNMRMSQAVHNAVQAQQQQTMAVDEGNGEDNELAPRRIFQTLEVQTDSHPFFKRTWNIRHVCNENSPLLSLRVRNMIAANDGFWPPELNSYEEVRKAINFFEIVVSFSGTANVSGSSVYTQKVYQYVDMAVGYTFANVLALDKEGRLIVDAHLLNDVKEQRGGGAEPISKKDDANFAGYSQKDETGSSSQLTLVKEEEEGEEETERTELGTERTAYDQDVREEKKTGDEIV